MPQFLAEKLEAAEKDRVCGEDEPRSEAADGETPSVHPRDGPACGRGLRETWVSHGGCISVYGRSSRIGVDCA